MGLESGKRFGSYEIVEPIGAGGMGEVYRARDTALKRDVAIKVLPAEFAEDADRIARFQREAETLAALNHVNIAQVFGLESNDGTTVIVMELVDGPTLADRLSEGAVPVDEALVVAQQLIDALEAAHGKGIVHRDLKPANIKLRPDGVVKVLDFGISTAPESPLAASGRSSPTRLTPALTEAGILLGTAAYMSPEQARGRAVDERADIWACGCILYEMLTGQPAFDGDDVTTTLARVLERETNFAPLPKDLPFHVRQTLELLLEKDPAKRIADIRDVRLALQGRFAMDASAGAATDDVHESPWRRRAMMAAALLFGVGIASVAAWTLLPESERAITRFSVDMPGPPESPVSIALSPDGRRIVYRANDQIYSHRLDQSEPTVVPGTQGGAEAFFSPDGESIAFFAQRELKTVGFSGEIPRVIGMTGDASGLVGAWHPDGRLIYGEGGSFGLSSIPALGGAPSVFAELGDSGDFDYPDVLPGGEWVLFTENASASPGGWSGARIVAQSTTSDQRRVVLEGGHFARYLPPSHLVFARNATLFAVAFDPVAVETLGPAVPMVQGITTNEASGHAAFAVAPGGTLVYLPGTATDGLAGPPRSLVWADRSGSVTPLPLRPDYYSMARLSPDGTRIALVVGSTLPATDPLPDIYVYDIRTESLTQLTFDTAADDAPVWSRDGSRIFFRSYRRSEDDGGAASGSIYEIPADGGTPVFLASSGVGQNPMPWSVAPNDSTLLLVDAVSLTDVNFSTLDLDGADTTTSLLDLAANVSEPSLSPDGQWLLHFEFSADMAPEINVRPYPEVRQQRRPVGPGSHPVFSADGSELFFFDGGGISVMPVNDAPFRIGGAQELFRGQYWWGVSGASGALGRAWDVDSANDRFLMITTTAQEGQTGGAPAPRLNVVLNWAEEVRERVPIP